MFKVVMSVFSLAVLVFGLSLQAAETQASKEIPVKVLSASFNSEKNSVDVLVTHEGCVAENYTLKLRGCTDFMMPYKCTADLKGFSNKVCENDTFIIAPFTVKELGLAAKKFKNATLIIKGSDSDKSEKKVILN